MLTMAHAAPSGKDPIVTFRCRPSLSVNYSERQRRLEQLRQLERAAVTLDERRSWRHAIRKVERALARAVAPSTRTRCASPAARARVSRAGGRRSPRSPRRSAAARAAPPGGSDPDPDPDHRRLTRDSEVGCE